MSVRRSLISAIANLIRQGEGSERLRKSLTRLRIGEIKSIRREFCEVEDETDWHKLDGMIEDEIVINVEADEDNPLLTDDELSQMKKEKYGFERYIFVLSVCNDVDIEHVEDVLCEDHEAFGENTIISTVEGDIMICCGAYNVSEEGAAAWIVDRLSKNGIECIVLDSDIH